MKSLRFAAVSNRLPITLSRDEDGTVHPVPGAGGLVTALAPVLSNRGGQWVGWPGVEEADDLEAILNEASRAAGYVLRPVHLTASDAHLYYNGFSNGIIWPLFHDLPSLCNFTPEAWDAYQRVNRDFAEVVARWSTDSEYIWVHDYQLMRVGAELREMGIKEPLGFFLHIPFPPLDMFLRLPWRAEVLRALLAYDLVGFQTLRDRRNFLYCVRHLLPGCTTRGKGSVVRVEYEGREVRVGSFPISIDYSDFEHRAAGETVQRAARTLREQLGEPTLILGVDRLDYTKGIPEKLDAFRRALLRYPDLQGKTTLVQVAVPSRLDVPEYQALRARIERLVGEINGQFTRGGWAPIQYIFRPLERTELLAHYVAADIALITPLKDGMNLVAKEYCASNTHENGTLILSEFAGAASQMHRWALTVNPHDVDGVATAIHRACTMKPGDVRSRMRHLRRSIKANDIYRWVDDFLRAAASKTLHDFPFEEEYLPALESPASLDDAAAS